MQLSNLIGLLVYAQPFDRSRPLDVYIVVSQTVEHGTQYLELVSTAGDLLSGQVELVPINDSAGGWSVPASFDNVEVVRQVIDSMTLALTEPLLTITNQAREEATNVRTALVDALAARARITLNEQREAEDARIAAERAAEDQQFDANHEALAADPNAPPEPSQEASLVVITGPQNVVESIRDRLRAELQ